LGEGAEVFAVFFAEGFVEVSTFCGGTVGEMGVFDFFELVDFAQKGFESGCLNKESEKVGPSYSPSFLNSPPAPHLMYPYSTRNPST
jgi:hypothetical protein